MIRAFRYKAKLNAAARRNAEWQLTRLCELYNAALEERREAWRLQRKSVGYFEQSAQMPQIKRDRPEYAEINANALLNALKRLDLAFAAFYRRTRTGQRPGYPRFRSARRYSSITFRRGSGWKLEGRYLRLQGIGIAKLFLSRPVEGTIKTVTLSRDACGDWWVVFSCEDVAAQPLPDTGASIGIDLGLTSFAALSDGTLVENPRPMRSVEAHIRHAARRVSKKARSGVNCRKAVLRLAKHHRRIDNVRRDFRWKLARDLVQRFDLIAVEDLSIDGLARGWLAKSVHDAGWGNFLYALASEAEKAGRELVRVNPRGTSQVCSECGCVVEKDLSVRVHRCDCGYVADRDVNAARNILARSEPVASRLCSQAAAMTHEPRVTGMPTAETRESASSRMAMDGDGGFDSRAAVQGEP